MSEASEKAFRRAEAEIARVKAAEEVVLNLGVSGRLGPSAEYLSEIPAEIVGAAKVTRLHLTNTKVSDLNPITGMKGLTELYLSGTQVSDLAPIAGMPRLTVLYLSGTQVGDLTPTAGMLGLTSLGLAGTRVSDLTPIAGMIRMTVLDLSGTQVRYLDPIAGMTGMTVLHLSATHVSNLTPIARMTAMRGLHLSATRVRDLTAVAGMVGMTTLQLSGTQVSDLGPISRIVGITGLDLAGTQVSDLRPIAAMVRMARLYLSGTQVRDLDPIAGMGEMTSLDIAGTQVSDIGPITGMVEMAELDLSHTRVSDLSPLSKMINLTHLDLSYSKVRDLGPISGFARIKQLGLIETQVSDLGPIARMVEMTSLDLSHTQVSDLGPIAGMVGLAEKPEHLGLRYDDTPATRNDPVLREIAAIKDNAARGRAVLDYLAQKAAPPAIPEHRPAPLTVELAGETLVRVHPGPPLPDGPVSSRAEIGWQEIRHARDDFANALNLDNYRAVKSAIGALDRGMGRSYADLNQIAVGMVGDRLARLAADAELAERMPEGAGAELSALAAQVQTLANRFPDWIAYLEDAEGDNPQLSSEAAQALGELAKELEQQPNVAPDVSAEFRDEVELARENPDLAAPVRGVLASTREVLRVLAEAVIGGAKAAGRGAVGQGKKFARVVPDELRKASLWGGVALASDILFNKSAVLLTLSTAHPAYFGWIAAVLRYIGAI